MVYESAHSPRVAHVVLLTQVSNEDPIGSEDIIVQFRQICAGCWSLLGDDFVCDSVQDVASVLIQSSGSHI